MIEERYLVVTADDFGIGPETSRGILELAHRGLVTGSVLLVNSPYAEEAVRAWERTGMPMDLGWHPCLTLDRPILPAGRVSSLVDAEGKFLALGKLMRRLIVGSIRSSEIEDEFRAQYQRFRELTGRDPVVVNSHHHVQVFSQVGTALQAVLAAQSPKPYIRCIREPWRTQWSIRGARLKRAFLSILGRRQANRQVAAGFPGNDWLAGITDPHHLGNPEFFAQWLKSMPGRCVELTCHPGHLDATVNGRDGSFEDGQLARRPRELELLRHPGFQTAVTEAGFTLIPPSRLVEFSCADLPLAA